MAPQRSKIIVGIDYGTTYSGISFVHSTAADFSDIRPWTTWPGGQIENNEHLEKVPSRYAYASENPDKITHDVWGYQVTPELKSCSWTKLLLDRSAAPTQHDDAPPLDYDDPALLESVSNGLMRLPPGKTAQDVVADYLRALYEMLMKAITDRLGGDDILRVTPMEFWLTMPAIWSDKAQYATMAAAKDAGFGSRPGDEINLISEPEAAAHLALKTGLRTVSEIVQVNTGVLVCDCGGGTVDVTSYTIDQVWPTLKLKESGVGVGGKCGGTYIDRNLHALLIRRYGTAFAELPPERIGPGSRFMREFESEKRLFGSPDHRRDREIKLRLIIPDFTASEKPVSGYDAEYGEVILSHEEMESCFEPIVAKIVDLVSQQVDTVSKNKKPRVQTVVLVGGLGSSPYVHERLKHWCGMRSIRLVYPWSGSWSAVVCGAVLRGLEGSMVNKKLCRRHYGQALCDDYDPIAKPKQKRRWNERWKNPWTNKEMVPGAMYWRIKKGAEFDSDTESKFAFWQPHYEGNQSVFKMKIYASNYDEAPERDDDPGIERMGEVSCYYGGVDWSKLDFRFDERGRKMYKVNLELRITMGSKVGTLLFRTTTTDGLDVGEAVIDFSQ